MTKTIMELKPLDKLIDEIIAKQNGSEKDRYMMKPSASDVREWENSAGGIDTNFGD